MKFARVLGSLACLGVTALSFAQFNDYPIFETDKTPAAELRARRDQVKAALGAGTTGVIFTNPVRNRNNDVSFRFRGDSNFIYLTGFEEPDSALIMVPGGVDVDGRRATEILFVNEPNLQSITWLGYRMGPSNAMQILGVEVALPNSRFGEVLNQALRNSPKLSVINSPAGTVGTLATMMANIGRVKAEFGSQEGPRVGGLLNQMRAVKSAYELSVLRKACEISARAHIETMKAIRPNMREYQTAAVAEFNFAKEGCEYVGYPSICGSGPNATILHYESNRRLMKDGELYLMDAAGEYHCYTADVTRTFPVNGKYTAEQKAIYEIVYDAQTLGISMCRNRATFGDISRAISNKMAEGLIRLGIIANAGELSRYYMHGFGHGIGLDVHDPLPGTLAPNMVLTVEPGIYIKAGSPCDKKWWNIGVRIEDDILVTEGEPENLSVAAPRKWNEIEALMKR